MNDKDRNAIIEQEGFKMLLEEFTAEQETHNKSMNELITTVRSLSDKIVQLEEKIKNPEYVKIIVNTTQIEQLIKKGLTDMKIIASTKQQPVVKKWQLLLFPENAYPTFQKIFLSRWIVFVLTAFAIYCATLCYFHWNDNEKQIQIRQLENNEIKKLWLESYKQQNKNSKHSKNAGS